MPAIIDQHRTEIEAICKKHDISYFALFGSFARGDQTEDSDIDFLVEFKEESCPRLFAFVGIRNEFTHFFNRTRRLWD